MLSYMNKNDLRLLIFPKIPLEKMYTDLLNLLYAIGSRLHHCPPPPPPLLPKKKEKSLLPFMPYFLYAALVPMAYGYKISP